MTYLVTNKVKETLRTISINPQIKLLWFDMATIHLENRLALLTGWVRKGLPISVKGIKYN